MVRVYSRDREKITRTLPIISIMTARTGLAGPHEALDVKAENQCGRRAYSGRANVLLGTLFRTPAGGENVICSKIKFWFNFSRVV